MRILLIEDDNDIVKILKPCLEEECFSVDTAKDGEKGLLMATTNTYDLIILDYILPKMDGAKVCSAIRKEGAYTPIVILTVKSELSAKIEILNMGADDYITKPFSLEELLARIRALLRRPKKIENEILQIENLRIDISGHIVKCGEKEIYLTMKEFSLLEYLARNRGRVVTRGMIMEHVWDMNADPFSNMIEMHIVNLRKKIEKCYGKKYIRTLPGRGYKID